MNSFSSHKTYIPSMSWLSLALIAVTTQHTPPYPFLSPNHYHNINPLIYIQWKRTKWLHLASKTSLNYPALLLKVSLIQVLYRSNSDHLTILHSYHTSHGHQVYLCLDETLFIFPGFPKLFIKGSTKCASSINQL